MHDLSQITDLETDRLFLRRLDVHDASALHALTNHKDITEIVHFLPTPFTLHDAQALLATQADGKNQFIGVWLKTTQTLVATIGTHMHGSNSIEIGYWVHPLFQRQGIAKEAVSALLAHLHAYFPEKSLVAECRPENVPSWSLLQKIGFAPTRQNGLRPGRKILLWQHP